MLRRVRISKGKREESNNTLRGKKFHIESHKDYIKLVAFFKTIIWKYFCNAIINPSVKKTTGQAVKIECLTV